MAILETTDVNELLQSVADLEPLIRRHSQEGERERRLPQPVGESLRDAGFFRMLRPRSRGGLEVEPVSEYRVAEALARIDSAAAWNVQVCNVSELFGGWFSDGASEEIFGSPESIVAGAFNPHRRASQVDGGYRISGRTPFNSNCHNATWFIGLADVYDGDNIRLDSAGQATTLLTAFPAHEATIVENWETLGMCGTGSHDVEVDGVYVPAARAVPFVPLDRPEEAYDWPSSRMAMWVTVGCHAAVSLGIAQAAIDELIALGLKVPAYTENALRNRTTVQMRLAEAEGKHCAARAFFYSAFEEAWNAVSREGRLTMAQKGRCQLAGTHAVMIAAEIVTLVHSCVGATGIRNEKPFQKHFRDAHVISQHAFVCESRLDAVGQIMFGLDAEWPFFGF